MSAHRSTTPVSFVVASAIIVILCAYVFLDGVFLYLSAAQIGVYGLFLVSSALIAVVALCAGSMPKHCVGFVFAWTCIAVIWLLPALFTEFTYTTYVLGDFAGLLLPALLLAAGLKFREIFTSRSLLGLLAMAMLLAAVLAIPAAEIASRHEPPPTLLLAIAWAAYLLPPNRRVRTVATLALALTLFLAWSSNERTAVLMWVAIGLLGHACLVRRLRNLFLPATVIALLAIVILVAFGDEILLAFAATRLESLAQGELDASLLNRVFEVQDAWRQWDSRHWAGFGHGATYYPELSYPMRNLTADGRVHHLHFGPMLLLYRYGIPGLLLFLWLIIDVIRYAVKMNQVRFQVADQLPILVFILALAGYLASFLVFNIIPDPAFSYALAGYLCLRLTQPQALFGKIVSNEWTDFQVSASS